MCINTIIVALLHHCLSLLYHICIFASSRYKEEYNKLISQCLVDGKFITIDKDDPTIASKGVNFASLKKDETKQQLRACVERKWLFLGKITCIASKECLDVLFACTLKYHGGTLGLIDWPMRGLSDFDNRYGSFYTSMSNYLPFLGGGITEIFIFNPADENDTNKRKGYIEGEGIKSHVKRLFERMVTLKFEGKDGCVVYGGCVQYGISLHQYVFLLLTVSETSLYLSLFPHFCISRKFDFSAYKCDVDDSNIDIFTTGEEKKETNKKRKDEGNPNEQKEKKKKE